MARTLGLEAARRFMSLTTDRIFTLPIAILMPHGGCNCRCIMCDIWKGNAGAQKLDVDQVKDLLGSLKKLHTRQVVMSGGEALMHPRLFDLCDILRAEGMKVTLLSTGLLMARSARDIVDRSDEVIVSLDGSQDVHDQIRRVPNAFRKLKEGVSAVKDLDPAFPVMARCVIQRENFRDWPNIIAAARDLRLDQISFLAADVTTDAFNRPDLWEEDDAGRVQIATEDLPNLKSVVDEIISTHGHDIETGFIAEPPDKLRRIYDHYAALQGAGSAPPLKCTAPWVSTVVEADGTVRPCFFHASIGNIHHQPLEKIINAPEAVRFRKNLDVATDPICRQCVCSLNLRPTTPVA